MAKGVSNISSIIAMGIGRCWNICRGSGIRAHRVYFRAPWFTIGAVIRRDAFLASAEKYGIEVQPDWIQEANHRPEGGRQAMEILLKTKPVSQLLSWPQMI